MTDYCTVRVLGDYCTVRVLGICCESRCTVRVLVIGQCQCQQGCFNSELYQMASVLTHKKVPERGGFNWDSPRQRHRFCYIVDGGASFFSDLGNQNISGFRHSKQIEIKNPQNI